MGTALGLSLTFLSRLDGYVAVNLSPRALTDFGPACGAVVVAEGIETPEDAAALLSESVDYGQGWHFGRPGPVDALAPAPAAVPAPLV